MTHFSLLTYKRPQLSSVEGYLEKCSNVFFHTVHGLQFLFLVPNILQNMFFNVPPKEKNAYSFETIWGWIWIFEELTQNNLLLICIVVISVQLCCNIKSLLLFIGYYQLYLKIRTENYCKRLFQDEWCVLWVILTKLTMLHRLWTN